MIFFDTETTGLIKSAALPLNQQPRIIEIGCIRRPEVKGRDTYFQTVFNPGFPIDRKITEITGLADDDLADAPSFASHIPDLAEFFLGEHTMCCHNVPFDFQMLLMELKREVKEFKFPWPSKRIDTVQMAMPFYNGKYKKLEFLYQDLVGLPNEQTHRAIDDVKMLMAVYDALVKKDGNSSQN